MVAFSRDMEILKSIGDYLTGKDIKRYYDLDYELNCKLESKNAPLLKFKNNVGRGIHYTGRYGITAVEIAGVSEIINGRTAFGIMCLLVAEYYRLNDYFSTKQITKNLESCRDMINLLDNHISETPDSIEDVV